MENKNNTSAYIMFYKMNNILVSFDCVLCFITENSCVLITLEIYYKWSQRNFDFHVTVITVESFKNGE